MNSLICPATSVVMHAFESSDLVGQGIVILLFLMAVYSWMLLLEKAVVVRRVGQDVTRFYNSFKSAPSPLEPVLHLDRRSGPLAQTYKAGMEALVDVAQLDPETVERCCRERRLPRALGAAELDRIRVAMAHANAEHRADLESRLPWLAIALAVGPMLGLLGFLWARLSGFEDLIASSALPAANVASAVSAAASAGAAPWLPLFVAVAGAIPVAAGYIGLTARVRRLTAAMDAFADDVLAALRFIEH